MAETFERFMNVTYKQRALLYLISPWETKLRDNDLGSVPEVINANIRSFLAIFFFELFYIFWKSRDRLRQLAEINDSITSMGTGIMSRLPDLFSKSIEIASYIWVYETFCIFSLPLNSTFTWFSTILAVDFMFYWFHRAAHEINILWALHQPHHSSEYYNMTTAMRKGVFQKFGSFIFYLPIALFVPPPMFALHLQLNLIYQFWIHSEVIPRLWRPLEFLLNTASHHRVHHGSNPYCIDKNYGGLLIVWDRLFGTFQAELDSEPVVYGLVHNLNSFDPVYVQMNHFAEICRKIKKSTGVFSFFKCFLFGPGWNPRKPHFRLGDPQDIPNIDFKNVKKFNPKVENWVALYCIVHAAITGLATGYVLDMPEKPWATASFSVAFIFFWSSLSFGNIFNRRDWLAAKFEIIRCLFLCLVLPQICQLCGIKIGIPVYSVQCFLIISAILWLILPKSDEKLNKSA